MTQNAFVVIDLQNDYFPGGKWTLSDIESAAQNARQALAVARERGDYVIHVRHEFLNEDAPFFIAGSEGAQIHGSIQPAGEEPVVLKNSVNSFHQTNLKALLDEKGIQQVTLVGAMSHMCIDAAARAGADYGYEMTVLEDACATLDLTFGDRTVAAKDVHASYMSALSFAYANVIHTSEFTDPAQA